MTKKGTATVVKKKGAKARESFESIGDEEDEAETPAKAKAKAKAKPKPKPKPVAKGRGKAAKEAGEPVSKWRAVAMAQEGKIALKDDEEDLQDGLMGENGLNGEGEEEDIKVEMQFEQEFV